MIIACSEDIYGRYVIQNCDNDYLHPLFAIKQHLAGKQSILWIPKMRITVKAGETYAPRFY